MKQELKTMDCGCLQPADATYCPWHNASLDCPVPDCEFTWPHIVAEHSQACGCWYFNAGLFGFCATHQAEEDRATAEHLAERNT